MTTSNDDFSNDSRTTGELSVEGGLTKGRIESLGDHDWLKVFLNAGQTYSFYVDNSGKTPDDLMYSFGTPLLALYDAAGKELASNAPTQQFFRNELYFNFTSTSTSYYYLDIGTSLNNGIGNYAVKAVHGMTDDYPNTTATTGVIAVNGQATGALQTGLDVDWFKTSLIKGHAYLIELVSAAGGGGTLGPDASPLLQVLSPTLTVVGMSGTNSQGTAGFYVNAQVSGDYIVSAGNRDHVRDGSGSYTIKVTEAPVDDYQDSFDDQALKVNIGSTVYGRTGHSGDSDVFRVEVQAGQTYVFSMKHEGRNFLSVFDADFSSLEMSAARALDDTAQCIYTPAKSGMLFVQVSDYESSLGQYSIATQIVTKEATPPKLVSVGSATEGGFWTPGSDIVLTFDEAIRSETAFMSMADDHIYAFIPRPARTSRSMATR